MTTANDAACAILRWNDLSEDARDAFAPKIGSLYGHAASERAFDALSLDKQQALILLSQRLSALDLWRAVRSIDNVWGVGGVGMSFAAYPFLVTELLSAKRRGRHRFTRFLARHRDSTAGFYERGRRTAALHFLYKDGANGDTDTRRWSVHFDYNSPIYSLLSAWRHLQKEFFGGFAPDWRAIRAALRFEPPRD